MINGYLVGACEGDSIIIRVVITASSSDEVSITVLPGVEVIVRAIILGSGSANDHLVGASTGAIRSRFAVYNHPVALVVDLKNKKQIFKKCL